ncbi:hypothetical protein [Haladaptatus sp. DYF46]|uniref:hypothetical protein n=1 Tax=Haladaptatus sp. DYF46 TaxID=2886041 RepID=UPI001E4E44C3|nr:hypothetical protein [Haladaptatus sp. DYF46]
MHNSAPDQTECPQCGTPYDKLTIVEEGVRWRDLFPGTVFDFFKSYQRRCTARIDVENDSELPERKRAIYFHSDR